MDLCKFNSPLKLNEEDRSLFKTIELLNERIMDCTLRPQVAIDLMTKAIRSDYDTSARGPYCSEEEMRSYVEGKLCDDVRISNHLNLYFGKQFHLPWTQDEVTNVHLKLTMRRDGYEPGRVRNTVYMQEGKETYSSDSPEHDLNCALDMLNNTAYEPIVASALFYNCLEMTKPFLGDNRYTYRALLKYSLYARGYRSIWYCELDRYLDMYDDRLNEARRKMIIDDDPNPMIVETIKCICAALTETYELVSPLDVKKTVGGISRSIIRHSRRMDSFVLRDAHRWLGDVSDQTFRSHINNLIDIGVLEKRGTTRDTHYVYVDPFHNIRRMFGGTLPYADLDELIVFHFGTNANNNLTSAPHND